MGAWVHGCMGAWASGGGSGHVGGDGGCSCGCSCDRDDVCNGTHRADVRIPREVGDDGLKAHSLASKLPEVIKCGEHHTVPIWDEADGTQNLKDFDFYVDV
jgi:hypothetical protein